MILQGCGTALVTPFRDDDSVDEAALTAHVDWQIVNSVSLLVPAGTTGEAATLSEEEWLRVVEVTVQAAAGRVPVFAGATHNSTRQAVANAKKVARIGGLTGILTANPYYNKPNQEGQYQHFKAISEAVDLPILLYNIPGRTAANLEPRTVLRLAELKNIVGIKESSGNLQQITELTTQAPRDFQILSGDDALCLPTLAVGGVGLISVASNAFPEPISQMVTAALKDDWATARSINRQYFALMQDLFVEPSPAPVKAVLSMLGRGNQNLRLPMVPISSATGRRLEQRLGALGSLGGETAAQDPHTP